jgi:membrane fusion protein
MGQKYSHVILEERTYRKPQALTPGMALEADIVQDRRAVWEWVLEPLLAAGSRWKSFGVGQSKLALGQ